MRRLLLLALCVLLLAPTRAQAQAIAGNASISVDASGERVALPANATNFPSVLIAPAPGTTVEIFYALGDGTVVAVANTSASLPSGGICINVGPSRFVGAITASGSATVRITQLSTCALFAGSGVQPSPAVTGNHSVVITVGNTFQTVLAAGTRRSLTIQNNNANDNCWIQYGVGVTAGNATKGASIFLQPGWSYTRYFPIVPSDEFEATCATSSDTLYVDTQ